ncbi:hypothetical protein EDB86DRAFT_3101243 [Lactarius hatsudake]|nr:hypothetical protein EDB86DRAFT_3101243 [Lactarius hatsudake]
MVAYCEPCGCNLSPNLLAQHNKGRKHLRKVASIGVPNPVTPLQPPPPPSNLPNARPVPLPKTSSPATNVPTLDASDPRVTVSHEDGLDFVVEGTEIARRPHFPPVDLAILIEKTEVESSLSIDKVQLFGARDTAESCFTVSVSGNAVRRKKPRRILVSFQAPHAGTFRMCLQIVFNDNARRAPGHGISVSNEDGVDFGIVERNGLNGPFKTSPCSVTIHHAEGFPAVTFVEGRIRSWDGSSASFKVTFNGRNRSIRPGTTSTVRIEFIPEFEGQFEATLQLVFSGSQLGQFAVSRRLRAIAGSVEDHKRFESLAQEGEDHTSPKPTPIWESSRI